MEMIFTDLTQAQSELRDYFVNQLITFKKDIFRNIDMIEYQIKVNNLSVELIRNWVNEEELGIVLKSINKDRIFIEDFIYGVLNNLPQKHKRYPYIINNPEDIKNGETVIWAADDIDYGYYKEYEFIAYVIDLNNFRYEAKIKGEDGKERMADVNDIYIRSN